MVLKRSVIAVVMSVFVLSGGEFRGELIEGRRDQPAVVAVGDETTLDLAEHGGPHLRDRRHVVLGQPERETAIAQCGAGGWRRVLGLPFGGPQLGGPLGEGDWRHLRAPPGRARRR